MVLAITFVGILQLGGLWAAWRAGHMHALDKSKWRKGGFLDGGWDAQAPLVWTILALAAVVTIFLPILAGMRGTGRGGMAGWFGGMGGGHRRY